MAKPLGKYKILDRFAEEFESYVKDFDSLGFKLKFVFFKEEQNDYFNELSTKPVTFLCFRKKKK